MAMHVSWRCSVIVLTGFTAAITQLQSLMPSRAPGVCRPATATHQLWNLLSSLISGWDVTLSLSCRCPDFLSCFFPSVFFCYFPLCDFSSSFQAFHLSLKARLDNCRKRSIRRSSSASSITPRSTAVACCPPADKPTGHSGHQSQFAFSGEPADGSTSTVLLPRHQSNPTHSPPECVCQSTSSVWLNANAA